MVFGWLYNLLELTLPKISEKIESLRPAVASFCSPARKKVFFVFF